MLATKCIYIAPKEKDGYRISVMSRHTLDDGKTRDPNITHELYNLHLTRLGPPPELVGAYYREQVTWEEFEQTYRAHLQDPEIQKVLTDLIKQAHNRNVTFLCKEKTPEKCHRRLLAEECQRLDPSLEVRIE